MEYDKPFKTLDEQLEVLEYRGLKIHNHTKAKEILMTYSYYDLINGYKDIFMPDDVFKPGVTLWDIVFFSYVDKDIQSLIMRYSLIAETKFKNHIAYVLAKNLGVHQDEYLNPKHYKKKVNKNIPFAKILDKFKVQLNGGKGSYYPTKYYVQNHNHVPPWILFKNVSLGTAINLFKSCNPDNKAEIANMLLPQSTLEPKEKIEFISIAMNQIRYFRNCTAHNLNFIKCRTTQNIPRESLYKLLPKGVIRKYKGAVCRNDKISLRGSFGILLSLYAIIQDNLICSGMFVNFMETLNPTDEYDTVIFKEYLKIADIPVDTKKRLAKLLPKEYKHANFSSHAE